MGKILDLPPDEPKQTHEDCAGSTNATQPDTRLPFNYGKADCECQHCKGAQVKGGKIKVNHGAYKRADELAANEVNRVSLPGDVDYAGCAL